MCEDDASREISPARRRHEVAAILAAGVLRCLLVGQCAMISLTLAI